MPTVVKKCDCADQRRCKHSWVVRYRAGARQREHSFRHDQKGLANDFALKAKHDKKAGVAASSGTGPWPRRSGSIGTSCRTASSAAGTFWMPSSRSWARREHAGLLPHPAISAANSAPSSQHASRSALPGGPVTVTAGLIGRQPSPVVIDSTARTAPPVSLPPCTYSP